MADKRLQDFPVRNTADDDDLILISSQNETFRMKFSTLLAYVNASVSTALTQIEGLRTDLSDHILEAQNTTNALTGSIANLDARVANQEEYLEQKVEQVSREFQQGDATLSEQTSKLFGSVAAQEIRFIQTNAALNAMDDEIRAESRRGDESLNNIILSLQSSLEAKIRELEGRINELQTTEES